jgi:predicted HicB family RNase H-like nuclease
MTWTIFRGIQVCGAGRKRTRKDISIREEEIVEMQKQLEMGLRVRITESQYEALKTVAEASGDTLDEYLHSCVIQGMESDIDLYFGHSKAIKEKLYKQVSDKDG